MFQRTLMYGAAARALSGGGYGLETKDGGEGGEPVAMTPELKAAFAAINTAFDEFKKKNDDRIKQIETKGGADVVTREQVDKINAEIDKKTKALDDAIAELKRRPMGDSDKKAATPEQIEYKKVFEGWFRKGANADELEKKATSISTDSDPNGGFLVPETMETTIDRVLGTVSAIRSISSVISISTGSYKKPVNLGGAGSGWVGEREARPQTDAPTLAELEFPSGEIYANPASTQRALDDARINIEEWLASEVSITFAEKEGLAFYSGDGVNKPRGISSYTMVADASYVWNKIGYVASGVAAALNDSTHNGADAITDLVYSLKQGYRQNARYLMNRATQAAIRKLKSKTEELYLWQPSIQAGQPATILGYPVTDDDNVPNIGANAYPIWFGDFRRGYLVVDRMGIRVLRDPYTSKPNVLFYTTKRVGGGIQNFEAIKALKIATS